MQPQRTGRLSLEDCTWRKDLSWEGEPVLSFSICFPKYPDTGRGLRRMGRYYRQVADTWRARWEGPLYQAACTAAQEARATSRPFSPWTCSLTWQTTFQSEDMISLCLDAAERTGGSHVLTLRQGDTWLLPEGTPLPLSALFPGRRWRAQVLGQVRHQISARLASGSSLFFPGWQKLCASRFDPDRFFLTEEGPVVFYPMYSIAPYVEGIPTFPLSVPDGTGSSS